MTEINLADSAEAGQLDGEEAVDYESEAGSTAEQATDSSPTSLDDAAQRRASSRSGRRRRILIFGLLPLIALSLCGAAGYLKFKAQSLTSADPARGQSVRAATEAAVAMLSYNPGNVDTTLSAAADRLTGPFRDSYTALVHDVVAPGAKQKKISATASVPAAASVAATGNHAVVILFINQATIMGSDAPTSTDSVVEATLDKIEGRWLISGFDPK